LKSAARIELAKFGERLFAGALGKPLEQWLILTIDA
jgi:hypothetical protein